MAVMKSVESLVQLLIIFVPALTPQQNLFYQSHNNKLDELAYKKGIYLAMTEIFSYFSITHFGVSQTDNIHKHKIISSLVR